jgi:CelD/BcsL family acetyltransferase involved in cellulose biosynthesis
MSTVEHSMAVRPRRNSSVAKVARQSDRGTSAIETIFTVNDVGAVLEAMCTAVGKLAADSPVSAPLIDVPWLLSWLEAFDPPEAFLLCAHEGGDLVGMAALQRITEKWRGCPLRVVQSLTNIESYRFDFLLSHSRVDIAEHLWATLCRDRRHDVIRLDHVPEGSPALTAGLSVARGQGWRVVLEETFVTPQRALESEARDGGLKPKFKANLRNRERHLAARGNVAFHVATAVTGWQEELEAFYQLEASGWKGVRGTAIVQQPRVKRLYQKMIALAPEQIRIPILTVSGQPVAAQVIRTWGRTMYMLKTAYDDAYADCAPGHLLTSRVLEYGIEHGMQALDFLADNARWKSDWGTRFLRHHRVLLFAPTMAGRYAYWVHCGLRNQAKRVPGVTRLIHWLREHRS